MEQLIQCIQTHYTDSIDTNKTTSDFINHMKQEYGIYVKHDTDTNRMLFRYHRDHSTSTSTNNTTNKSIIKPDLTNPLVQVCRGLVCDVDTMKPICYTFHTKLEYERFRETVPWDRVRVTPYYDGTLINVYHHLGEWRISTRGMLDAKKAYWFSDRSFEELFRETFSIEDEGLDTEKCYSFVLQHRENRIVSNIHLDRSILVRVRDMKSLAVESSGMAEDLTSGWTSYREMETAVQSMTYDEAGLFLEDTQGNGVHTRIMSPEYTRVEALRANTPNPVYHLLDIRNRGLRREYLAAYPESDEAMHNLETIVEEVIGCTHDCYQTVYVKKTYVDIPVHLRKLVHNLHDEYYRRKLTQGCKQPAITPSVIADYFNRLTVSHQYRLLSPAFRKCTTPVTLSPVVQ